MVKGLRWVLLKTLQVIGVIVLSTYWLGPALAYLIYMAMVS
jgi:hypothetical protein